MYRKVRFTIHHERNPRIGVSFHEESGLTAFIVPRFWFDGADEPLPVLSDDRSWIVLPDMSSTSIEAYLDESSNLSRSMDNRSSFDMDGRQWISFVKDPQSKGELKQSEIEFRDRKDDNRLRGFFHLLWWTKQTEFDQFMDLFGASELSSSKTLLHEAFVSRIEHKLTELRRTYSRKSIHSSLIKGRIDVQKSAMAISHGIPSIHSIYDDFSLESPHYSSLMTALEWVNAYHLKERYSLHEAAIEETPEFNLAERSSMLRSRFREIPSLSPQIALNTLMTQRLPPQLRAWRPTFELAKAILSGKGAKARSKTGGGSVGHVYIEMSKIWEKILEFSASKLDLSPSFQAGMQPPWKLVEKDDADSVRKKPDIVLRNDDIDDRVLIIDAKYTNRLGPRDYDDQTLMYALIDWESSTQSKPEHRRVVLFNPSTPGKKSVAGQNQTLNIGWLKSQNEKVITKSNRSVAFPNPEQVMEWRKRDMYLSERKMDFEAEWDLMNDGIKKSDGS